MALNSSNRSLWYIISRSAEKSTDLVNIEINKNKERLTKVLSYYKSPSCPSGESLKSILELKGNELEFVKKISQFLCLEEKQSYDLYQTYLYQEYRGARSNIEKILSNDRHMYNLMLSVRDFYNTERLYLLRCVSHLLCYYQDEGHPCKEVFEDLVETITEKDQLINTLLEQYADVKNSVAPTWETHGNYMNESQATVWMLQNLKEQGELLELILLYYKHFQHPPECLWKLAKSFKDQAFGERQANKHLLKESMNIWLQKIGHLQVLIVLEGMDLEYLQKCQENANISDHHIIKEDESFKKLDTLFCNFGDCLYHGPIILAWSIMRQVAMDTTDAMVTRRLGNTSLELHVFRYLTAMLSNPPCSKETMVAKICQYIVYGLMSITLSLFHEDTLGETGSLHTAVSLLMKQLPIAGDMLDRGTDEAMGTILGSALSKFPLEFSPLLELTTSLSSAGKVNLNRVVKMLEHMRYYTEHLDRNSSGSLHATGDEMVWRLARHKYPYNTESFMIKRGTVGQLFKQPAGDIIQWNTEYSAWQLFQCEISSLIDQTSNGVGYVYNDNLDRVTSIVNLLKTVISTDVQQMASVQCVLQLLPDLIEKMSTLSSPPVDLLASCLEVMSTIVTCETKDVWMKLQQTQFLPFLTENIDNLQESARGTGLSGGLVRVINSEWECVNGRYPLTLAFLKLISNSIQPLRSLKQEDSLMACLIYTLREIFPVFQKWRYYTHGCREEIGGKCLQIFHRVLSIQDVASPVTSNQPTISTVCIHSLLNTEAGRALLDILSVGVDAVNEIETDTSHLLTMIRLGFSVLNRLLLLRPPSQSLTPMEHFLSSVPSNQTQQHIIMTIAQYIYHRQDPRLPSLAILVLKRLAMIFPMSILGCFGNESLAIRDVYLSRLKSLTEEVRLKIVILEFLSVCVETQPGLIEMFLDIKQKTLADGKQDFEIGEDSCLSIVLESINERRQRTVRCPPDLVRAIVEFIHALWAGQRLTAMTVLHQKETFWPCILKPLMSGIPPMSEDSSDFILTSDTLTCAFIFKILAEELYNINSSKLDVNIKKCLQSFAKEGRTSYWSAYVKDCLVRESTTDLSAKHQQHLADNPCLQLTIAWKNFLIVLASLKGEGLPISNETKSHILEDILISLQQLVDNGDDPIHQRLVSILSALYFTLIRQWNRCIKSWKKTMQCLESVLHKTCANSETLLPSIQIGLAASLTVGVQCIRKGQTPDFSADQLPLFMPIVCDVLQQSTYQLPHPGNTHTNLEAKLKLQETCICLLQELIEGSHDPDKWLPSLQQHMLVPLFLGSLQQWMKAKQGVSYVHSILQLFLTLAKDPKSAEVLSAAGFTHHTCLQLESLYQSDQLFNSGIKSQKNGREGHRTEVTWFSVYRLTIDVYTSLLKSLKFSFIQDALNFSGVHQKRIEMCLRTVKVAPSIQCLSEAECTCQFLMQLSHFKRDWRLHLQDNMNTILVLMCDVVQTCVAYMIRPRVLNIMLDKGAITNAKQNLDDTILSRTSPVSRLQHQTSSDDLEAISEVTNEAQQKLLQILSCTISALRQFSPDLCEVILDQNMDLSEFEPFLAVGFSTPSLEGDLPLSFGCLISCVNMCIRMLNKSEPRGTSPLKSPAFQVMVDKQTLQFVLESSLHLILSQSVRYIRDGSLSPRDKQFLKRELAAELTSCLSGLQRFLRKGGPLSPASGFKSPQTAGLNRSTSQTAFSSSQDQAFFKIVADFVTQVLR